MAALTASGAPCGRPRRDARLRGAVYGGRTRATKVAGAIVGGMAVPAERDPLIGSMVGAYRVESLLGMGGMGRVYAGVQPVIGSRVAIKVLSAEHAMRGDLVERFFAEAKVVNLIRHESIVNIIDLHALPDGRPYIVMELLEGAPLGAVLEQSARQHRHLPLGGIGRMLGEVLDAVGAAHDKGVVHRDLKPDNIFIAPSGRPKVLDFGIAKLDVAGTSTRTGALLGTPFYMSPEQCAGRSVDHRADIYALGVILFECATGQKPFVSESLFELLRMHVEQAPPRARAFRPDLPPGVEQVIDTALAKEPERRFASARAMGVALQHAIAALPVSEWEPLAPPTRPGPTPAQIAIGSEPTAWIPPPAEVAKPTPVRPAGSSTRALIILGCALALVGIGISVFALTRPEPTYATIEPMSTLPRPDAAPTPPDSAAMRASGGSQVAGTLPVQPTPSGVQTVLPADPIDAPLPPDAPPDAPIDAPPDASPLAQITSTVAPPSPGPRRAPDGFPLEKMTLKYSGSTQVIDVDRMIEFVVSQGPLIMSDLRVYRIDMDGLRSDGTIENGQELATGSADISFRLISQRRTEPDPNVAPGAKTPDRDCEVSVMVGGQVSAKPVSSACEPRKSWTPRCSVKAVWKLAIQKGAPANGLAQLAFYAPKGDDYVRWSFSIKTATETVFSQWFYDDCKGGGLPSGP